MNKKELETVLEKMIDQYLEKADFTTRSFVDVIIVLTVALEKILVHGLVANNSDMEGAIFHINDFFNSTKQRCIQLYKQVINRREQDE